MSLLFSNAYGDAVLARFFGAAALANITEREFSLWAGNPHAGGTEVAGTGYVRQLYSSLVLGSFIPSSGANGYAYESQVDIGFPDATTGLATGNWTQATHIGISNVSAAAPNFSLAMPAPVTVLNTERITFPTGSLKFELGTPENPWLISHTWANDIMEFLVGQNGTAPSTPATWHLSLWLGNPFAGGSEVSTSSSAYARRTLTNATGWTAPAANAAGYRAVSNVAALRWPASGGATANWGTVLYIGFSTGSGTAPLFARKLPGSGRPINTGGFLSIPIGGLEVSLFSQAP